MRLNFVCDASPPPSTSLLHTAATILIIPCFKCRAAPSHRLSIRWSTPLHVFSAVKHTLPIPSILYGTVSHPFQTFYGIGTMQHTLPIPSNSISTVLCSTPSMPPIRWRTPSSYLLYHTWTSNNFYTVPVPTSQTSSALWYRTAHPSNRAHPFRTFQASIP